jgi:hypothetical protein
VGVESGDEGLQLGEQSPPFGHREGTDDADRGECAVVLVEPQQKRADRVVTQLVDS